MIIVEKRLIEAEGDDWGKSPGGVFIPPSETKKPKESKPRETTSDVSTDTKNFEISFRNNFYNKGKNGKEKALNDLDTYMNNGGQIRSEFLSGVYKDIYKYGVDIKILKTGRKKRSESIANDMVIKYLKDFSNKAMGEFLNTNRENFKEPFINDFVNGMGFEALADKDNVFMRLVGDSKIGSNSREYQKILTDPIKFSQLFNICAKYENDSNFKDYCGYTKDGLPILTNPDFYTKVKVPEYKESLVKYDINLGESPPMVEGAKGSVSKRTILNNAISNDKWKSYALSQNNTEKEEKDGYGKYGSKSKKPEQIAREMVKDLKGKSPDDIKSALYGWAKDMGIKNLKPIDNIMDEYSRTYRG